VCPNKGTGPAHGNDGLMVPVPIPGWGLNCKEDSQPFHCIAHTGKWCNLCDLCYNIYRHSHKYNPSHNTSVLGMFPSAGPLTSQVREACPTLTFSKELVRRPALRGAIGTADYTRRIGLIG